MQTNSAEDGERIVLRLMKDAPRDGTEILGHSEAGNFHPVIWISHERWAWKEPFSPYWGMRWNEDYRQHDNNFNGWIPMPEPLRIYQEKPEGRLSNHPCKKCGEHKVYVEEINDYPDYRITCDGCKHSYCVDGCDS